MSRHIGFLSLLLLALMLLGGPLLVGSSAQKQYDPPRSKAADWDRMQQEIDKDLLVCQEHCAGDAACLSKCDQVDAHRRNQEYQRLMLSQ